MLKQSSQQEVGQLWTQLESMRASRQELGGETHLVDAYCFLKYKCRKHVACRHCCKMTCGVRGNVIHCLTELKEQLLARSSRVEDIERLKTEFNEQKREIQIQNEAELESLRKYVSIHGFAVIFL